MRLSARAGLLQSHARALCLILLGASLPHSLLGMAVDSAGSPEQGPRIHRRLSPLTRVSDVRGLDPISAASSLPVRITGVITAFSGYKNSFFFQDATAGISVDRTDHAVAHVGDRVEVRGATNAGSFAPIVMASHVKVLGPSAPPRARIPRDGDLAGGAEDSQWIEVRGVVHAAQVSKIFGRDTLTLNVQLGGGLMRAMVEDWVGLDGNRLIDATISIRGVCATTFNAKRQFVGLGMFVPRRSDIHILAAAPSDPFAQPSTPVRSALQFGQSPHRVKVAGTVTYQEPGRLLYLQDGSDGIRVQTLSLQQVPVGTRVEAVGFPVLGDYAPMLEDGFFRVTGSASPLAALHVRARDVISDQGQFDYVPYDEQLLELDGVVVETYTQAARRVWLMRDENKVFEVSLPSSTPIPQSHAAGAGSTLRVTGICAVHASSDRRPTSFSILLRSPGDIVLVHRGPWWTAARTLLLLSALAVVVIIITLWVVLLRHRVRQQTRIIRESEERFRMLAEHDALTGLPNRLVLEDRSAECLTQSKQHALKAAVFTIDIDRFKQINDAYGHPAGDECLKEVARRLRAKVRRTDMIARTGGEEFTLVAGCLMTEDNARKLSQEMLQLFCEPITVGALEINLTISIGAALYPDDGVDAAILRKRSDQALYQAKRTGRNRVVFATQELSAQIASAMSVESSLREGLLQGSFFLEYQPIYDAFGAIRHFEALLRTKDPNLARIGPSRFIPAAEENGLILPIGQWVLEQVCRQIAAWKRLHSLECSVNVNVSARQLLKAGFAQELLCTLSRYGVEPRLLQLELTETTAMKELTSADNPVAELTRAGVTFAIDDFGTGYSSLARLRQLSIHTLKIDQSFLVHLERDKGYFSIIKAIIQMAKSLNMQVVAEGVENLQQHAVLLDLGCDLFQGFFFAMPVASHQACALLLENQAAQTIAAARADSRTVGHAVLGSWPPAFPAQT